MRDFVRAASAEILKLKRTLALWLAILSPLLIVVLNCLFVMRMGKRLEKQGSIWDAFNNAQPVWAIFLLPLLASLLTALLNSIEHKDNNWKQLFALPVSRWSVYASKVVAAMVLLALSTISLWLGGIGGGYLSHWLAPKARFGPAPWWPMGLAVLKIYAASVFLIAIQVWVSARAKTFTVPLGLGMAATLASMIAARDEWLRYWPWMLPMNTLQPDRATVALALGLAGGLVIAVLGAWDTARRDVL